MPSTLHSCTGLYVFLQPLSHVLGCEEVGLEVSVSKCHWASYPCLRESQFSLRAESIQWEDALTFVGSVIDLTGNESAAVDYRIAQATKVWGAWRSVLTCKSVAPMRRAGLLYASVFNFALWLAECSNSTQATLRKLNSWGARKLAQAYGVRRNQAEDGFGFWRRIHRNGYDLYQRLGGSLVHLRSATLHRWAGHLARTPCDLLRTALRTRCLAWWRFVQHPRFPLHGRRFGRPHRWEAQLTFVY